MANCGSLLLVLGLVVAVSHTVLASDPDLTTDLGINSTSVSDFTYHGFRNIHSNGKGVFTVASANFKNFPGLTGLALSALFFEFGSHSQIFPHIHPRGNEIFFLMTGKLNVGFVDTDNNLFETTLEKGDLFVFPKGLIHFQRNNYKEPASGFSAFSSENPGLLDVASALFTAGGTGLPNAVLGTALDSSIDTIKKIKAALS